jgi:hypothetical protein
MNGICIMILTPPLIADPAYYPGAQQKDRMKQKMIDLGESGELAFLSQPPPPSTKRDCVDTSATHRPGAPPSCGGLPDRRRDNLNYADFARDIVFRSLISGAVAPPCSGEGSVDAALVTPAPCFEEVQHVGSEPKGDLLFLPGQRVTLDVLYPEFIVKMRMFYEKKVLLFLTNIHAGRSCKISILKY